MTDCVLQKCRVGDGVQRYRWHADGTHRRAWRDAETAGMMSSSCNLAIVMRASDWLTGRPSFKFPSCVVATEHFGKFVLHSDQSDLNQFLGRDSEIWFPIRWLCTATWSEHTEWNVVREYSHGTCCATAIMFGDGLVVRRRCHGDLRDSSDRRYWFQWLIWIFISMLSLTRNSLTVPAHYIGGTSRTCSV